MATKEQMELVQKIIQLAMQISIQGKYHVFAQYSGHCDLLDVYALHADNDYQALEGKYVDGLVYHNHSIGLAGECGKLENLVTILESKLDRDDDGVPL